MQYKNKIIKFIANNRYLNIISGIILIYIGLGWIGVIEGWSGGSLVSKVLGVVLITGGGIYIISSIIKMNTRRH